MYLRVVDLVFLIKEDRILDSRIYFLTFLFLMLQKNTQSRTSVMRKVSTFQSDRAKEWHRVNMDQHSNDKLKKDWSGQGPWHEQGEPSEHNPSGWYHEKDWFSMNRPSDNLEKDWSGQRQWPQDKQTHEEKSLAERRSGNRHHVERDDQKVSWNKQHQENDTKILPFFVRESSLFA